MASSRRLPSGTARHFSTRRGGDGTSDEEELSRIDDLMAMGRQCLCVRNREEGHALLLAHAMDAAEADIGLLFEVAPSGKGHLIAAQGLSHFPALCDHLRHEELPLDLELAALFREKLGLPQNTRCFESPLLGRDGPCGVLVLFWLETPPRDEACSWVEESTLAAPGLSSKRGAQASRGEFRQEVSYLERVAEQCAQSLEHLRISWNLEQALERIEASRQREREQLAFFSAVAHELRSPLNALFGGLQLFDGLGGSDLLPPPSAAPANLPTSTHLASTLKRADRGQTCAEVAPGIARQSRPEVHAIERGEKRVPAASEAAHRTGQVVRTALQRLSRLIDDLADLGRLGMGRMSLRKERCELTGLLSLALDKLRAELEGAHIELRADFGNAPLFVEADSDRLAQIFDNLLSNARRYTEEGFIEVKAALLGNEAFVCIQDSGMGIPAEQIGVLFEPFWSERAHFDGRQGGMGIGLSIAHQLVVRQGGRLEVTSEGVGKGSRFEIRFPLKGDATGG